jgi:RNA polymerase sigma factor (TIGR02999 family)
VEKFTLFLFEELHRVARRCRSGERSVDIPQIIALVNEVYLRLVDCDRRNWQDRTSFVVVWAPLMRRILIDFARSCAYPKRGANAPHLPLDEAPSACEEPDTNLAALDGAWNALAVVDGRKSRGAELKFLGELSAEETAEVFRVSPETVLRDWRRAKARLLRELCEGDSRAT